MSLSDDPNILPLPADWEYSKIKLFGAVRFELGSSIPSVCGDDGAGKNDDHTRTAKFAAIRPNNILRRKISRFIKAALSADH